MPTFHGSKAQAGKPSRTVHAGVNVVVSKFVWGVNYGTDSSVSSTAAAGDIIRLAKLPKGATVTRVVLTGNRDDGSYKLGTDKSASLFATLISASAGTTTASIGIPYYISISDEAAVQHEWLQAEVVSAGYTLSDQIEVIVEYLLDN